MKDKKIRNILIISAIILIVCAVAVALILILLKDKPPVHNMIFHSAKPATCTEDGVEEYWECQDCNKLFADEDGKVEIKQIPVVSALGHNFSNITYACSHCNETNDGL